MPQVFRSPPPHFARLIRHLQRHGFYAVDSWSERVTIEDLWFDVQTGSDTLHFCHRSEWDFVASFRYGVDQPRPNAHRFWLTYYQCNGLDNPSDYGDTPLHGWSSAITSFMDSESARHP